MPRRTPILLRTYEPTARTIPVYSLCTRGVRPVRPDSGAPIYGITDSQTQMLTTLSAVPISTAEAATRRATPYMFAKI